MQRYGVLFVHDPVIELDLAEILSAKLTPIKLYFPKTAADALALLKDAVCVVTDRKAHRDLRNAKADISVPQLYFGIGAEPPLSRIAAAIEPPFTNNTVISALTVVGLAA